MAVKIQEKMCMVTVRIKTPMGKKRALSSIAPSTHHPLPLAFVRRPFLGVEVPSTGTLHNPIVKYAKCKITF